MSGFTVHILWEDEIPAKYTGTLEAIKTTLRKNRSRIQEFMIIDPRGDRVDVELEMQEE